MDARPGGRVDNIVTRSQFTLLTDSRAFETSGRRLVDLTVTVVQN